MRAVLNKQISFVPLFNDTDLKVFTQSAIGHVINISFRWVSWESKRSWNVICSNIALYLVELEAHVLRIPRQRHNVNAKTTSSRCQIQVREYKEVESLLFYDGEYASAVFT